MKTSVVVGGGIAGIYSAILLAKSGRKVVLVEQAPVVGGLLNSYQNKEGDWFDYGTHFIAGTQIEEIDEVMLPETARQTWQKFDNEHGANFFAGRLNSACLFVDSSALPEETYNRGLKELLEITELPADSSNLKQQLERTFGRTFSKEIFAAALGKLFGVGLEDLVPDSHLRFGMKRIQVLTPQATVALKQIPCYDERISFHQFSVGIAARPQYYPKIGGAGEWIRALRQQLDDSGVEQLTGTSVTAMDIEAGSISNLQLSSGLQVAVDEVIWTAALPPICKLLDVPLEGGPPKLRYTSLMHLVLDKPPSAEDHFFFCYDPLRSPFRVTLYTNLQPDIARQTGRHRVTIEVLSDGPLDSAGQIEMSLAELIDMSIFPLNTKLLFGEMATVEQGFPVLTAALEEAKINLVGALNGKCDNLKLLGRNCSDAWFMHEVLRQVHRELS